MSSTHKYSPYNNNIEVVSRVRVPCRFLEVVSKVRVPGRLAKFPKVMELVDSIESIENHGDRWARIFTISVWCGMKTIRVVRL